MARSPAFASPIQVAHPGGLASLRCWHAQQQQQQQRAPGARHSRDLHGRAALLQQDIASTDPATLPQTSTGPSVGGVAGGRPAAFGHIELVVGPMFAGKTSELLRRVEACEAEGLTVAVVKSNKDTRYAASHVVTHDGVRKPCFAVPTLADFRRRAGALYAALHVIAVDEAQFFPDLLDFCTQAADADGKRLILAGLDGDSHRRRFGQVLDLIPMADAITKLTASCAYCQEEAVAARGCAGAGGGSGRAAQRPAVFSLRIAGDPALQEDVGGADKYAPVCRRHYVQLSAR